jgi:predicted secreted hydrolase
MSGEIEVTEEIRRQFAEETQENLKRLGLNPERVEPWEDGYRTADETDAFEWWYFDGQLDDGSTLVLTFNTKPSNKHSGPLAPSVLMMYRPADGERNKWVVPAAPDEFSASKEGCDVRVGPSWVKGDLHRYEIHAESEGMVADLELDGQAPPWRPGAAVSYFNSAKTKYFAWVVPVPYGTVKGTLQVGGKTLQVRGTMYHDHNWGNATLGNGLDHWYWGRAHVGDFSLIYVQMVTVKIFGLGGIKLPVLYLSQGDRILTDDGLPLRLETSGSAEGPGGQTYPTRLDWSWRTDEGSVRLTITEPRLIESIDMTEDMPGWKRPLVHAFANPYYYDFDADLELEVDLGGVKATEHGRTVFEKMMFR